MIIQTFTTIQTRCDKCGIIGYASADNEAAAKEELRTVFGWQIGDEDEPTYCEKCKGDK